MLEFENLQLNLSTLSKKRSHFLFCTACKFNDLAIIPFSPALSHWAFSVLFTMVFPGGLPSYPLILQTKYHCFRETLFDPLNLKVGHLDLISLPHQYLSHPAALGGYATISNYLFAFTY